MRALCRILNLQPADSPVLCSAGILGFVSSLSKQGNAVPFSTAEDRRTRCVGVVCRSLECEVCNVAPDAAQVPSLYSLLRRLLCWVYSSLGAWFHPSLCAVEHCLVAMLLVVMDCCCSYRPEPLMAWCNLRWCCPLS